jgi:hypothetical protein
MQVREPCCRVVVHSHSHHHLHFVSQTTHPTRFRSVWAPFPASSIVHKTTLLVCPQSSPRADFHDLLMSLFSFCVTATVGIMDWQQCGFRKSHSPSYPIILLLPRTTDVSTLELIFHCLLTLDYIRSHIFPELPLYCLNPLLAFLFSLVCGSNNNANNPQTLHRPNNGDSTRTRRQTHPNA